MDAPTPENQPPAAGHETPSPDWSHLNAALKDGAQQIQALEEQLSAARNVVRRLLYVRSFSPGRIVRLEPLDPSLGKLRGAHVRVVAVRPDPTHGVMVEAHPLSGPAAANAVPAPSSAEITTEAQRSSEPAVSTELLPPSAFQLG